MVIMELFLQIAAIALAILGIIGSIVPALPGPPLAWLGMLCAFFCGADNIAGHRMSLTLLLVWLGFTILCAVLDYIVPIYMTKVTGGHKKASIGATIGLIAGIFLTPIGMIAGCLLGAFLGELSCDGATASSALKASLGTFLGIVTGTLMKLIMCAAMIYYIVIYI